MPGPIPIALHTYVGSLVLDNSAHRAYFAHRDDGGNVIRILMMLDTAPSGDFDPQRVIDAWRYFGTKPGIENGSTITVVGFWNYAPNSDILILHVVRG